MRLVELIMRVFSVAFHGVLGLLMMAVAFLSWSGGQHTLRIEFLPWQGDVLEAWLFGLGLAGVVITILAAKKIVPVLFAVWSLAVVVMLVRGYFFGPYNFAFSSLSTALYFTGAALLAFVGSVLQVRQKRAIARRQSVLA